jgi:hypothetical protein
MASNFTNINKTNNRLSSKLTEHKTRPRYMMLQIQGLSYDRHKNVTGLNLLMEPQLSPFDNGWIKKLFQK